MNKRVAFPFLTINDESINASPWLLSLNNDPFLPVSDHLEHWDYSSQIRLNRTLSINWSSVSLDLSHPKSKLPLELLVQLGTGAGNLPRKLWTVIQKTISYKNDAVEISIPLTSENLSQRLYIKTQIILSDEINTTNVLVPSEIGARLWTDIFDIRLEGGEPRFPVEEISLGEIFKGKAQANALWYLHWQTDTLNHSFSGAVRLYLNADYPDFVSRFQQKDKFTLQMVLNDVISQLVEKALPNPDFQERADMFEEGSIGANINNWLCTAFGNLTTKQLNDFSNQKPGEFRAALLSLADVSE
ncbi:hypothetical protein [Pseudomonas fluorescens]|uniref:Uncharacterized protein n=1 Tax=Pseudomonas fluorescens TaxID=294 RepID=A0A5E7FR88_PSEFL|nr:hypothetical protein [Pseudomonas fluorescens]VVO42168.1 hypothetical protein PS710_06002 [Pseudomonas fluorescens]